MIEKDNSFVPVYLQRTTENSFIFFFSFCLKVSAINTSNQSFYNVRGGAQFFGQKTLAREDVLQCLKLFTCLQPCSQYFFLLSSTPLIKLLSPLFLNLYF